VPNPRNGFFGIGIYHTKTVENIGTLWRSAHIYGASFVFTVGRRYREQASDTPKTIYSTPLYHYDTVEDLVANLPWSAPLVGVDLTEDAVELDLFQHPARAVYLLGAEDHGLPEDVLAQVHHKVVIPTPRAVPHNVAVAGSVVMHDRYVSKLQEQAAVELSRSGW
jgi:tRNA G18 (ribose-2'-O)-methylase SpoU